MQLRTLGRTGIRISEVGLGTWGMGGDRYGRADDAESRGAILRALELGINHIDTAPIYGNGRSEEVIGDAIAGRRHEVVLASKVGMFPGGRQNFDYSGPRVMREVEQSLRRLRTDYLDIFYLHSPDEDLFRDDGLEALVRLKEQGKIRATGFSVMSVDEGIPLAMRLIDQGQVDVIQQAYRLLYTLPATELFPMAEARNVGVIARENFYFGFLTGAITRKTVFDDYDDRRKFRADFIDAVLARVEKLDFLTNGRTMTQAALQFVLATPGVHGVIPGAMTVAEVEDNVRASGGKTVTTEEMAQVLDLEARDYDLPPIPPPV
ncbi:MAG: aldo/keto reductase [Chloroflexi bacterium]|nr:aldo/keto reductase [Chloroflexota bacterium]